jgi:hypothetical protein
MMKLVKIYVDEIPPCCGACIYNGGYFYNWCQESRCALVLTEVPDWDIPQAKLEIDKMYKERLPDCPLELTPHWIKLHDKLAEIKPGYWTPVENYLQKLENGENITLDK